jgi:short-subunit dehydrogenase
MARRPVALVTGASSGIGAALARRFAAGGHDVVLVARRAGPLQRFGTELSAQHGVRTWALPADLTRREVPGELAAAMRRARRPVDVLVNCAGVLEAGAFARMAAERHRELIDLNVGAPTALLAHFVPAMVRRGHGRVLNVASIAAFQPVPTLATYAATKAYVLSLSASLAEELQGTGVTVTALCPGITATPMVGAAVDARPSLRRLPDLVVGDAEAVATEGYDACLRGDVICVPGALNLATVVAGRALPKWLVRRVGGAVARRFD